MSARWRGVVDLGTMSTELLLVSDGGDRIRRSVDTAMGGAALGPAGEIVAEAIGQAGLDRVATCLDAYQDLAAERGAELRAVATAAARRATDRAELAAVVERRLGVSLEVLDGPDEAATSFHGAVGASTDDGGPVVTIDLGGGSTDLAVGTGTDLSGVFSMPIGGSLLTRAYLTADPPRPDELSAALSVVELHVDDLVRELPTLAPALADGATVHGLGGIVTIAAVEIGLAEVDPLNGDGDGPLHGAALGRDEVEEVFRTLATEARDDRRHNPGLPPARVDDIVGGCAVLVEIMRQLDLDGVVISQRGLADGVLARW